MKLALVMLPEETGRCDLVTEHQIREVPKVMLVGPRGFTFVLLCLFICTAALVGGTLAYSQRSSWAVESALANSISAVGSLISGDRDSEVDVVPLTPSVPLQKGDRVMLKAARLRASDARTVAALPFERVLVMRDGSLRAVYLLGGSSYVVGSPDDPAQLVRIEEIAGVLP